jgi:molybdopterin synthase sulfur carrier subunit
MATVKLFGNLRKLADGLPLQASGSNVQAVVDTICEGEPSLCEALFQDGIIRPHYKITINGHDIALARGLDTPVSEDDQIAIFPPIAGG